MAVYGTVYQRIAAYGTLWQGYSGVWLRIADKAPMVQNIMKTYQNHYFFVQGSDNHPPPDISKKNQLELTPSPDSSNEIKLELTPPPLTAQPKSSLS